MLQIHLFSSSECTQLQTHTRTHPHMRTPIHTQHACSKSPFSVYASARRCTHTCTQALTLVHTHTHACCYTHLNDVENACPESTFSIQANVCEGTQTHTHTNTHTHTHTRMLVFAHKLYPPAFTCTHQNDVMYAGPKSAL